MQVTVAVAAVVLTACSNSPSGPTTITDPVATIQDLVAVDSAFNTPQLSATASLANFIGIPAPPAPLSRVVAALHATLPPPPRAAMQRGLHRPLLRNDLRLLAGLAGPGRAPVIPDTLLGLTFVWDTISASYISSNLTGAPLNGVRFVLYDTTAIGVPDPAVPIGSLDIIDKAPAVGAQLQFILLGETGSPTFLDYTLTYLPGTSGFTIDAVGFVSNGRAGALERRFTFNAAITHTDVVNGESESVDFIYAVNVPNISVNLHLADDSLNATNIVSIDYKVARHNANIRLLGADTTISGVENGVFAVTVNGNGYATGVITSGVGVIKDHSGNVVPVNSNDQQYEDDVFLTLLFGSIDSTLLLAVVLAVPAALLGFTFGLL
jgi:hypothetical protein